MSVFEICTDFGLQNLLLENTIVVLITYVFLILLVLMIRRKKNAFINVRFCKLKIDRIACFLSRRGQLTFIIRFIARRPHLTTCEHRYTIIYINQNRHLYYSILSRYTIIIYGLTHIFTIYCTIAHSARSS